MDLFAKKQHLISQLQEFGKVAVAYSSGVDSTFLLKLAHDVLGDNAIAITVCSRVFPNREKQEAADFCHREGIRQIVLNVDELSIEGFAQNPPDRCYICKKSIFRHIQTAAASEGFTHVLEGSNMDDMGDYRPGMRAIRELGILSPLKEAELYKSEIRELSHALDLPTWDKPSFACLASRFVYGETISEEKLRMVEQAEDLLLSLGFRQERVRVHGNMARIEVEPSEFQKLILHADEIHRKLKALGFTYITMDLGGYHTGSMNQVLKEAQQ